jgi:hypothetical protein
VANVDMIWASLVTQIETAMAGTNTLVPLLNSAAFPTGAAPYPQPGVVIDWPPVQALAAVTDGTLPTIVSIFDRGAEKNITCAIPLFYALPPTAGTPGASVLLNTTFLPPGGTVTITGSGTPLVNDAFCLTLLSGAVGQNQILAEYQALSTDTLTSALTAFTAAINLLTNIAAVLLDNVITVTNNTNSLYTARSEVVNVGTFTQEGYRWDRDVQVTVWSRTPSDRSKYGNILEALFSQLEVNYGFLTSDQSACRVIYADDHVWRDSQLQDIYRRDFTLKINYPVLNVTPAFAIEQIPQTYQSPVPD